MPIKNWFAVIVGMVLCTVLGFSSSSAFGQAYHTSGAADTGLDWFQDNFTASNGGNTVWVRSTIGGNDWFGTGIAIDPYNILVTGHQVWNNGLGGHATNIAVGTGSNYLSDPGWTTEGSNWLSHHDWDGSLFSQKVDLGIVHIPEGVPGIEPLTIGASVLDEELRGGGFGELAIDGQWQGVDGNGYAGKMWVDEYGLLGGGSVSTDYIRSVFLPTFMRDDPMAFGATPGSSGSGVFNLDGDLVGLTVGVAGSGMPNPGYSTFSLRVDLYEPWILDNMYVVPSPASFVLLAMGGLVASSRRRRA